MTDLPRKAVVRSAKLASVPLGFAGRTALGFGKRIGGKPAEVVAAELQARTAQQLFQVLGELKGGAMKFGQALSIFEAAFPEEIAVPYRATLTKLQDSAPPMPTSSVHEVLRADFGTRWRSRFASFDDHPVASASIGQVHRGVWADGRDVAVKIQYPGAGAALMGDLRQISRVAKVAAGWVPGLDLGPILDELRDRMAEELDYRLEAESQATFAAAFTDDEDFSIPAVVAHAEHVIVSEWLEGKPLSQIISDGTPEERDDASQLYLEFLLAGPAEAGLLHADPHPGNFRMTPDNRLGVIDFGAVNRLPDGMPAEIGPLLTTGLEGSAQERARRPARPRLRALRHRPRPAAAARLPRAVHGALPRRRVHLQPRLAPRRLRPHQRSAAAQLRRRLQAQPAAGVPPHPPRVGWQHRGAVPARRHGARTRDRRRAPPGRRPAAGRPARRGLDPEVVHHQSGSSFPSIERRCSRLHRSHVHATAAPLLSRLQVSRAVASCPGSGRAPAGRAGEGCAVTRIVGSAPCLARP